MTTGEILLLKIVDERRAHDFVRLKPETLSGDELKLYKFIYKHFREYGTLPTIKTVREKYGISDLEYEEHTEPYSYYFREYQSRTVYMLFNQAVPSLTQCLDEKDGNRLLTEIQNLYRAITSTISSTSRDVYSIDEVFEITLETLRERRTKAGVTGIPTGWQTLDNITHGFQRGDIFLVVARVKVGKTACLIYMASHAQRSGYIPMFISMEMTKEQIGERLVCLNTGININYVRSGELTSFAEEMIIEEIRRQKEEMPKFYYLEGQLKKNIGEITSLVESYRPDILFIDGAYLIKPMTSTQGKQKWEQVGEVIDTLKTVAMQFNIPIVPSYQFNRQVSRRAHTIGAEAFEKIQLSDAISQLASSGIAILDDPDSQPNIKQIELIGGRYGEAGSFKIKWDWERMDFSEITEGEFLPVVDIDDEEGGVIW